MRLPRVDQFDFVLNSFLGRQTRSTPVNYDQTVTEALFFAVSLIPPRLNEESQDTFKSKPRYRFLRLIRIREPVGLSQAVVTYVVLCESTDMRAALRNHLKARSSFNVGLLAEPSAISSGNAAIVFVRGSKQYVIDELCHNLNCLHINLEEAVRSPE